MGKVLLFYKYVTIEYPKRILKWQQKICADLGLMGRILIAHEGINGTLGGRTEDIDRYVAIVQTNPLFADVDFKTSPGNETCFPRLQVVVRDEAVHFGVDPEKCTAQNGGQHLSPQQTHELIKQGEKDLMIFDARNVHEWRIGKFQNAITPDIKTFRDLPEYIDTNLDQFKDKQVLMYCTGGVRCERATTYLKQKGVAKKVYQIEGGIHRYVEQYPDGFFRGKNYVFDSRVGVRVNDDVISSCDVCAKACDDYMNCESVNCNKHFICCASCWKALEATCSPACRDQIRSGAAARRKPFVQVNVDEPERGCAKE